MLCEDASRIRRNPGIFARLRSFAYKKARGREPQADAGVYGLRRAACPICEFQTTPPHDGRTHRNQKKKGPFAAAELKEKGLLKV
jgi:hypothetical protein